MTNSTFKDRKICFHQLHCFGNCCLGHRIMKIGETCLDSLTFVDAFQNLREDDKVGPNVIMFSESSHQRSRRRCYGLSQDGFGTFFFRSRMLSCLISMHLSSSIQTDIILDCAPAELPMMFDGVWCQHWLSMQASWVGTLALVKAGKWIRSQAKSNAPWRQNDSEV